MHNLPSLFLIMKGIFLDCYLVLFSIKFLWMADFNGYFTLNYNMEHKSFGPLLGHYNCSNRPCKYTKQSLSRGIDKRWVQVQVWHILNRQNTTCKYEIIWAIQGELSLKQMWNSHCLLTSTFSRGSFELFWKDLVSQNSIHLWENTEG